MPLPTIETPSQPDRNLHQGGRSFYFFDFDDNVMHLQTPIYVFDKSTSEELAMSTGEFAEVVSSLGQPGAWQRYSVDNDDRTGSFRRFRDRSKPAPGEQPFFVEDMEDALRQPPYAWKGPSWDVFHHAVLNERPLAIITARGHSPEVMRAGIGALVRAGHLDREPNYLGIYGVSHAPTRRQLGDESLSVAVPKLKHRAIVAAVKCAMAQYGVNEGHRFGMSDDDSSNVERAVAAMGQMKRAHPNNSFFVIDAGQDPMLKTEILGDGTETVRLAAGEQLGLFG